MKVAQKRQDKKNKKVECPLCSSLETSYNLRDDTYYCSNCTSYFRIENAVNKR